MNALNLAAALASDRDNGPPSLCRVSRRSLADYRVARAMQAFTVRPVEVLP